MTVRNSELTPYDPTSPYQQNLFSTHYIHTKKDDKTKVWEFFLTPKKIEKKPEKWLLEAFFAEFFAWIGRLFAPTVDTDIRLIHKGLSNRFENLDASSYTLAQLTNLQSFLQGLRAYIDEINEKKRPKFYTVSQVDQELIDHVDEAVIATIQQQWASLKASLEETSKGLPGIAKTLDEVIAWQEKAEQYKEAAAVQKAYVAFTTEVNDSAQAVFEKLQLEGEDTTTKGVLAGVNKKIEAQKTAMAAIQQQWSSLKARLEETSKGLPGIAKTLDEVMALQEQAEQYKEIVAVRGAYVALATEVNDSTQAVFEKWQLEGEDTTTKGVLAGVNKKIEAQKTAMAAIQHQWASLKESLKQAPEGLPGMAKTLEEVMALQEQAEQYKEAAAVQKAHGAFTTEVNDSVQAVVEKLQLEGEDTTTKGVLASVEAVIEAQKAMDAIQQEWRALVEPDANNLHQVSVYIQKIINLKQQAKELEKFSLVQNTVQNLIQVVEGYETSFAATLGAGSAGNLEELQKIVETKRTAGYTLHPQHLKEMDLNALTSKPKIKQSRQSGTPDYRAAALTPDR